MLDGFTRETLTTAGGAGPSVLPLHGFPQTHGA